MPSVLEFSESVDLRKDQAAMNLAVWERILAEPYFHKIEGRIETNAYGEVIMSPPPAPEHGQKQSEICFHLRSRLSNGRVMTECPLSTSDGVKGIDVAWMSFERMTSREGKAFYTKAPEICVEVISPSNTIQEMAHKKALYFEAGALEVWFCSEKGEMSFYLRNEPDTAGNSTIFPEMTREIETF